MDYNLSNNYDTPMQTGSPNSSPIRQDNFGYNSFHTPYKVEQSLSQFNQTQKQFDNRYLTPHAVSIYYFLIKNVFLLSHAND